MLSAVVPTAFPTASPRRLPRKRSFSSIAAMDSWSGYVGRRFNIARARCLAHAHCNFVYVAELSEGGADLQLAMTTTQLFVVLLAAFIAVPAAARIESLEDRITNTAFTRKDDHITQDELLSNLPKEVRL